MADPDVAPIELDDGSRAGGKGAIHEIHGGGRGPTVLDDGIDDLAEGVAHGADALEVGVRPAARHGTVEDLVLDEPGGRIARLMELVDELAGFELVRVEEFERGIQGQAVLVVGAVCHNGHDNHSRPLDRLRASG